MTEYNRGERYLEVTVGERAVCVPVSHIDEIVNPGQDRRLTEQIVAGKSNLVFGDRNLPMVDLRRVFDDPAGVSGDSCRILIAHHGDHRLALLVDSTERILCPDNAQIDEVSDSEYEQGQRPISGTLLWDDQRCSVLSLEGILALVRAGK
ncbi:MAG: chemotaxis protein CheW [candidate division Zixibacteria bacterium]|nr:chemotaxis protein CheW [candidate division Zixibacteria bacterium]